MNAAIYFITIWQQQSQPSNYGTSKFLKRPRYRGPCGQRWPANLQRLLHLSLMSTPRKNKAERCKYQSPKLGGETVQQHQQAVVQTERAKNMKPLTGVLLYNKYFWPAKRPCLWPVCTNNNMVVAMFMLVTLVNVARKFHFWLHGCAIAKVIEQAKQFTNHQPWYACWKNIWESLSCLWHGHHCVGCVQYRFSAEFYSCLKYKWCFTCAQTSWRICRTCCVDILATFHKKSQAW